MLDRPEAKNALTVAMRDGIVDAVRDVPRRPDGARGAHHRRRATRSARAWTSARRPSRRPGKPGFDPRTTSEALRVGVQTFIRELWELDKPTVAAVNGAAVGPGAHLALACDFVLVHPRTRFIWSFAKWGLVADAGGAYLLPRLVGLPRAKAMVMLGEGATGAEAVDLGLAYRCVDDPDALLPEALALARTLAAGPDPLARPLEATAQHDVRDRPRDSLELEGHFQALATTSPDLVEGMAAFREKRDAKFTGDVSRAAAAHPARRGVQRLRRRRRSPAAVPAVSDITEAPGLVDAARRRHRLRRASRGRRARASCARRPGLDRPHRRAARGRLAAPPGAAPATTSRRLPQRPHHLPHRRSTAARSRDETDESHRSGRVVHARRARDDAARLDRPARRAAGVR